MTDPSPLRGFLIQRTALEGAILLASVFPLLLGMSLGPPGSIEMDILTLIYSGALFAMIIYLPRLSMALWLGLFLLPFFLMSPIFVILIAVFGFGLLQAARAWRRSAIVALFWAVAEMIYRFLFSALGAPFGGAVVYKFANYFLGTSFSLGAAWGNGVVLSPGLQAVGIITMVAAVVVAGILSFRLSWLNDMFTPKS